MCKLVRVSRSGVPGSAPVCSAPPRRPCGLPAAGYLVPLGSGAGDGVPPSRTFKTSALLFCPIVGSSFRRDAETSTRTEWNEIACRRQPAGAARRRRANRCAPQNSSATLSPRLQFLLIHPCVETLRGRRAAQTSAPAAASTALPGSGVGVATTGPSMASEVSERASITASKTKLLPISAGAGV